MITTPFSYEKNLRFYIKIEKNKPFTNSVSNSPIYPAYPHFSSSFLSLSPHFHTTINESIPNYEQFLFNVFSEASIIGKVCIFSELSRITRRFVK